MAASEFQTVNVPHVKFLSPRDKKIPVETYNIYNNYTPGPKKVRNISDRSQTEWGFTKDGMVELPRADILTSKGRSRNPVTSQNSDPRLHAIVEKGNWHRNRNSTLRWNQASMFSQKNNPDLNSRNGYTGNEVITVSLYRQPSAYEVSLRKKGMLPNESSRPVTGFPRYREQTPRTHSEVSQQTTGQTSIGVNTVSVQDIDPNSQAFPFTVSSPPVAREIAKAKLLYTDEASKRRRVKPRPKTSSSANIFRKSNESDSEFNLSNRLRNTAYHWSPCGMLSEEEMRRAYSSVTGEKIALQSRASSRGASRTAGRADLGDGGLDDPPLHRNLRTRTLKSAPLSSLLKRQIVPTSYTIYGDEAVYKSESGSGRPPTSETEIPQQVKAPSHDSVEVKSS